MARWSDSNKSEVALFGRSPGAKPGDYHGTRDEEWQRRIAERDDHPQFAQRQCSAKSKRSGKRCRQWALKGSDKCRMHSGAYSKKGWAGEMAKSGKYSKYILGGELRDRYHEIMESGELTRLSDELGLIDTRLSQMLESLGEGDSSALWDELTSTWTQFMMAVRVGDSETQNNLLPVLNRIITRGSSISNQWDDLFSVIEKRRKVVETENKRIASSRDTITVQQAILMLNMVIEATRISAIKYADKKTAFSILADAQAAYSRLVGTGRDSRSSGEIVDGQFTSE